MKTISIRLWSTICSAIFAAAITGSFVVTTAEAQQVQKRKFGPGQNIPRAVGPRRVQPRQQAAKPPAKIIAKHGKWVVQCDGVDPKAKNPAATPPACGMIQVARSAKNKKIGLTLIIGKAKQGKQVATMMRIIAPIGVYLPTGIALEVDGAAVGRVPFSRCVPGACVAFAEARKETIAKMKKGSKGRFLIYEAPGIGVPLDLDLTGFTAALDALDKTVK